MTYRSSLARLIQAAAMALLTAALPAFAAEEAATEAPATDVTAPKAVAPPPAADKGTADGKADAQLAEQEAVSLGNYLAELDPDALAARLQETERDFTALERKGDVQAEVVRIERELGAATKVVVHDAELAEEEIARAPSWTAVSDIAFQFAGIEMQLARIDAPLDRLAQDLGRGIARAEAIRKEWAEAAQALTRKGVAPETRKATAGVIARAGAISSRLKSLETKVMRARAELENLRSNVSSVLESAHASTPGLLSNYALRGPKPAEAWHAALAAEHFDRLLLRSLRSNARAIDGFVRTYPLRVTLHALLLLALLVVFFRLHGASAKSGERVSVIGRLLSVKSAGGPLEPHIVYRHPVAGAVLTTSLCSTLLYPVLPAAGILLTVGSAVIAAAIILIAEQQKGFLQLGVLSLALLGMLAAHIAFDDFPAISQLLLAPEALLVGLVAFGTAFRPVLLIAGAWGKLKSVMGRAWLVLLLVGVIGWLLGYKVIAVACISGTSRVILLTIVFQAGYSVVVALLGALFHSAFAQRFRAVREHGALLLDRSRNLVRWLLILIWLNAALTSYSLKRDLFGLAQQALAHRWEVGTLSLSLGDLCVFGLGLVLSIVGARLVKFLLDEEVLPRSELRIGTAAAVSSGTYFLIVCTGFFMAFAAAGLQMERLTIVVSALGVGIGFGLQNIVQNFVAGLILLFGRPINVNDVVQVQDLTGRVTKVGARASTVRTFTGAEVIVPNSAFVSEQVINWSLSDETRRVDLDVGVAYGTPAAKVIELLVDVAQKHPEVLKSPAVEALFIGFGDSALNFQVRAWIAKGDRWVTIKSHLGIAVYDALNEAKIEIPFPQTDLHVRTVKAPLPAD
jgi:small-conductance mechanosensitive channel